MKKLKITFAAMAIAVGTFAAFAFSPAKADATLQAYHWFDANNGNPLGQRTAAEQQAQCGSPLEIECAYGYMLDENGNIDPGSEVVTFKSN